MALPDPCLADDEPVVVEVLVHQYDEEECEPSPHPGDDMDNLCIHGYRLMVVSRNKGDE